jgi:cobalt-zinc-cadmium efflux system protein
MQSLSNRARPSEPDEPPVGSSPSSDAQTPASQPHTHRRQLRGQGLRLAFLLAIAILIVEVAGGLLSHSLAVLSDAAHMLTDVVALGLAWFAAAQGQRPPNARWTYGYHRVGILTAMINGASLIVIAFFIAVEAYNRLLRPTHVAPGIMAGVGAAAVAVNLVIAFALQGESHDLNSRAALLHILGDIGASAGVIVGALLIAGTGALWIDPVLSVLIAVLISLGAVRLVNETITILLNATPRGVSVQRLASDMRAVEGVRAVHDLHVWAIGSGMNALSSHVVIDDLPPSESAAILDRLGEMLRRHQITHTTIQFESAAHEGHTGYCACPPGMSEQLHCEPAPVERHDCEDGRDHSHERSHDYARGSV